MNVKYGIRFAHEGGSRWNSLYPTCSSRKILVGTVWVWNSSVSLCMALPPPVLSSPKLCAREKRCTSHKDRGKQHILVHICKTSPQPIKKLPKQPLDESRSIQTKCRCHKQRHHRSLMFDTLQMSAEVERR